MAEQPKQRNDAAFALVLLLLCVVPVVGYWWWDNNHGEPPANCEPVVYELRPGTTLELRAVSFGKAVSNQFWSPNGIPVPQADLTQAGGGPDARMRTVYFQYVTQDEPEDSFPRLGIYPSPVVPGVGAVSSRLSKLNAKSGTLQTYYESSFGPKVTMFESTELEVAYSSLGFFDVGVLDAGETEKEFSVAGATVVVSLGKNATYRTAQWRIEASWKASDIRFDFLLIDDKDETVRPNTQGRKDNRDNKLAYAEFSEKEFSQIKIRAFHRDKKIKFSGISYNPGSYTKPIVSEVTP